MIINTEWLTGRSFSAVWSVMQHVWVTQSEGQDRGLIHTQLLLWVFFFKSPYNNTQFRLYSRITFLWHLQHLADIMIRCINIHDVSDIHHVKLMLLRFTEPFLPDKKHHVRAALNKHEQTVWMSQNQTHTHTHSVLLLPWKLLCIRATEWRRTADTLVCVLK